jgi:hypothetical protein
VCKLALYYKIPTKEILCYFQYLGLGGTPNDLQGMARALPEEGQHRLVSKLSSQSKQAGQEHTEASQSLTFVPGLHDGFSDFTKDYFSGRVVLTNTSVRDTTALAKTLEHSMKGKPRAYRNQDPQDSDIESFPVGSEIFAKLAKNRMEMH